jgi:uncharacterized protein YecT (DUF1311 family)
MITFLLAIAAASSAPYTCTQSSTNDLVACALSKYKQSEAALNREWKAMGHPPKLLEAQRAWLTYRNSWCEAANIASPDGSLYPVSKYLCLAELNDEQVERLHEIAER